ncbi:unnamed protein product [Pedinophyceae sp. YPF-701]|nr:unnamed protein product [Pedinophyceae sp. YPF-701]
MLCSVLAGRPAHALRETKCSAGVKGYEIFSPSKINVFLRIVGKRPDGFHELASLFHVIDLGETLTFEDMVGGAEDALTCDDPGVPTDSSNLVLRAIDLYRKKTGHTKMYRAHIAKRVPFGGGLGGGSANASTTLFALNDMAGGGVSEADLLEWSAELGSDCPVFFSKGAAYVTGRGEFVEDVPSPFDPATRLVLVKPPVGLSTPEIFRAFDLSKTSQADPKKLMSEIAAAGCATQEQCVNDLELPSFTKLPELEQLKEALRTSGCFEASFMTGSGSTMVGMGGAGPLPPVVEEARAAGSFVTEARFITRKEGEWFKPAQR